MGRKDVGDGAAVGEQVSVGAPQSADASESENTTLGISFIGLANGPEAPGQ